MKKGNEMAKGDAFWAASRKMEALKQYEAGGQVADSMEVRKSLICSVHCGEITLEQAQAELKKIKRGAKKAGMITRAQAFSR